MFLSGICLYDFIAFCETLQEWKILQSLNFTKLQLRRTHLNFAVSVCLSVSLTTNLFNATAIELEGDNYSRKSTSSGCYRHRPTSKYGFKCEFHIAHRIYHVERQGSGMRAIPHCSLFLP